MTEPGNLKVNLDTKVEELVEKYPKATGWLVKHGIVCIRCGEPFWGTLGELIGNKQIANPDQLITELNAFIDSTEN